jgi:hypothetical protein
MKSLIRRLPRFLRVALFDLIEEQVNEIDEHKVRSVKETVLALTAAALDL